MGFLSALDSVPLIASIESQSQAASQTVTQATYVDVSQYDRVFVLFNGGDMDSGTLTLNCLQATDAAGTGSKALTAGGFAQQTNAVDDANLTLEGDVLEMDLDNDFKFFATQVVTDGSVVTAAFFSVSVYGVRPRHET